MLPLLDVDDPDLLEMIGEQTAPKAEEQLAPAADPDPAEPAAAVLDGIPQAADAEPVADAPHPAPVAAGAAPEPLAALREIARKLRQAPDSDETLQMIIETTCVCTGSDAGMLTLSQPHDRQAVWGSALGAGPYISLQLRTAGSTFGELVLTRLADSEEYRPEQEIFADLVADYVAKAVGGLSRGTVLSDAQQDFLDRVTEELRAPVASAGNVVQLMVDGLAGAVSDEQREYLATAAGETRRLLRMLDDLLGLSRLRPPESREMVAVPVGPWLRAAVERHAAAAQRRGIRLGLRDAGQPFIVLGVPEQLEVMLEHLLSNALKFSEEGGEVEVDAADAEGMLRLTVSDSGIGFDPADATRMLDCFTRATNAEAARIPGMGIGLYLASEIAKNHSGRLWLESQRDEGTRAHVALPLLRRESA